MPRSDKESTCDSKDSDQYRLILDNVRDFAIFSTDLHGQINKWNPGAERFFGYTGTEILGQPMELLYVPEDRAAGRAELEKAQAAKTGSSEDERWHLKKDGTRFFVSGVVNAMYDDQRRLCGFIKIARDITQRRLLEQQLSASESKHRSILEGIKDFAIVMLDLQGLILTWNPGAELTFGFREQEVIGQSHTILFPQEDRDRHEPGNLLAEALRLGISQGERWLLRKDGTRVFVIDVLRPMVNEFGQVSAVLKVSRDVTERHLTRLKLESTQRELQQIRGQLEHQVVLRTSALEQTIQSLELVLYHVAHDLRAPLRTMEGFSSILVNKFAHATDPEAGRLTDLISEAARQMDRLIQDLLTYGRLCHEPVRYEKVELQIAVERAALALESEIKKTGAEVKIEGGLPSVWGDLQVVTQVLIQLLSNALRFGVVGRKSKIRIWAEPRNPCVRLWMEDNGVGIAPEYLDRIFWLFERLSQENNSSTGMGLPIARKGIERMQGAIGVESTPGVGSRFWIELPSIEAHTL
jgi:PAS domain S-box-containing protein